MEPSSAAAVRRAPPALIMEPVPMAGPSTPAAAASGAATLLSTAPMEKVFLSAFQKR